MLYLRVYTLVISHHREVIMLFTRLLKVVLFRLAPRLSRIPAILGANFLNRYDSWYETLKRDAIAYHKAQLRELDPQFYWNEAREELQRRCRIAEAQGIDRLDPRYPNIEAVIADWK